MSASPLGPLVLNYDLFLSLKLVLTLANSADPDEMQHTAAFHLGLHCLSKYPFRGFQHTRDQTIMDNEECGCSAVEC